MTAADDDEYADLRRRLADPAERERAVEDLIADHLPAIRRFARAAAATWTDPARTSSEVESTAALKLWRRVADGRVVLPRTRNEFHAFIRTLTNWVAKTTLGHGRPVPGEVVDPVEAADSSQKTPSGEVKEFERLLALAGFRRRVEAHLGPDNWRLFELRFVRGLSWLEIAAAVAPADPDPEKLAHALRMRVNRLRNELRVCLADPTADHPAPRPEVRT